MSIVRIRPVKNTKINLLFYNFANKKLQNNELLII